VKHEGLQPRASVRPRVGCCEELAGGSPVEVSVKPLFNGIKISRLKLPLVLVKEKLSVATEMRRRGQNTLCCAFGRLDPEQFAHSSNTDCIPRVGPLALNKISNIYFCVTHGDDIFAAVAGAPGKLDLVAEAGKQLRNEFLEKTPIHHLELFRVGAESAY
jgi:hypothetical protein